MWDCSFDFNGKRFDTRMQRGRFSSEWNILINRAHFNNVSSKSIKWNISMADNTLMLAKGVFVMKKDKHAHWPFGTDQSRITFSTHPNQAKFERFGSHLSLFTVLTPEPPPPPLPTPPKKTKKPTNGLAFPLQQKWEEQSWVFSTLWSGCYLIHALHIKIY